MGTGGIPQQAAGEQVEGGSQIELPLVCGYLWDIPAPSHMGLVFATRSGTAVEPRNISRSWYAIRERAGLGSERLHDLRHSCASFLLAAPGRSPQHVEKSLGHSQIGLTMNTYTHVLPDIEQTAVDAAGTDHLRPGRIGVEQRDGSTGWLHCAMAASTGRSDSGLLVWSR